jgi:hypothetical protein
MSTSPNGIASYYLHGEDFHKLSKLETQNNKTFQFNVVGKTFTFTKEEAYLLSPKGYSFILENSIPFKISLPTDPKYHSLTPEDLIQAFEQLSLLFSTLSKIEINSTNILVFEFLSFILENPYLEEISKNVSELEMQNQVFELSSKMLKEKSNKIKTSLYDFKIFIDAQELVCNKAFCCCLSEAISQIVFNDTS